MIPVPVLKLLLMIVTAASLAFAVVMVTKPAWPVASYTLADAAQDVEWRKATAARLKHDAACANARRAK